MWFFSVMGGHEGVGLNQKQYINKDITCGMGLHLISNIIRSTHT